VSASRRASGWGGLGRKDVACHSADHHTPQADHTHPLRALTQVCGRQVQLSRGGPQPAGGPGLQVGHWEGAACVRAGGGGRAGARTAKRSGSRETTQAAQLPASCPCCPCCCRRRDYFYHIAAAPGSGEYALRHLLSPGAWAHAPLEERLKELKVGRGGGKRSRIIRQGTILGAIASSQNERGGHTSLASAAPPP
jgi:hypothetical protein